jgi:tubulin-specific chaperone B
MQTAHDIPLLISSTVAASERRITPSWTLAHLKTKLEPMTGIPPHAQKLSLKLPGAQDAQPIDAGPDGDEEKIQIGNWPLQAYAEIVVSLEFDIVFSLPKHFS